jgi:hypothetical protein
MSKIRELLSELSNEDFLAAFAAFEIEGKKYPASLYYDIAFDGKFYPPKPIIALAYKNRFGDEINTTDLGQGNGSKEFKLIESLGYDLVEKKSTIPYRVSLYDVHGPAALANYENLLNLEKKIFLWDDKRFQKLQIGDFVFWINRKKRQALATKVVSKEVKPSFENGNCLVDYGGFQGKAQAENEFQFPNFYAFEIIEVADLQVEWNYTDPSTFKGQVMSINLLTPGISQIDIPKKIEKLVDVNKAFNEIGQTNQIVIDSIEYLETKFKTKTDRKKIIDFNQFLLKFDSSEVTEYVKLVRRIINFFDFKKGDSRLVFNYDEAGLYFTIGQRYAVKYTPKSTESKFFICCTEKIGNLGLDKQFDGPPEVFFARRNELNLTETEFNFVLAAIRLEISRSKISRYLSYHKKDFEDYIFDQLTSEVKQESSLVKEFIKASSLQNLNFSTFLSKRYVASLATKPFVIFTGLSGSGKTKLAQTFAKWISIDDNQFIIVPVGADWTNREPLLGYPNGLDSKQYVLPDNGALNLILNAIENAKDKELSDCLPYFLILDEMNLSHVERYFADFLSGMESKEPISLYTGNVRFDENKRQIPKQISLPPNLFIVGTVNIDETTYMFSPKVLDRANTIEFRLDQTDLEEYFDAEISESKEVIDSMGAEYTNVFMELVNKDTEVEIDKHDFLLGFFDALQSIGAEFGYRTANEMSRLIFQLEALGLKGTENSLDVAVMQKLLPKLHGSRTKLNKILPVLASFCLKDQKPEIAKRFLDEVQREGKLSREKMNQLTLVLSFAKIARMYCAAQENGFASYAEG